MSGGMMYVPLGATELGLAALLLAVDAALSVAFRLGLERTLLLATARMVVQLAAVGMLLKVVFTLSSPLWIGLLVLAMVGVAAYEGIGRRHGRLGGWSGFGLGATTLLTIGGLVAVYATAGIIGAQPWYTPRYLLPILGMVIGSMLTGISLALQTLGEGVERERDAIETRLALGGTRFAALGPVLRRALNTALTPTLNALTMAGMVGLPGLMSGQILAGIDPLDAAMYQVLVLLLLAGATVLGVLATLAGGVLLLTDARHRLRGDGMRRGEPEILSRRS